MNINIELTITNERIADLLTTALEGGANYWYMIEKTQEPTAWISTSFPELKKEGHWLCDYPLNPNGALFISNDYCRDEQDKKVTKKLTLKAIKKGLQIMAQKYPAHFAYFISEN